MELPNSRGRRWRLVGRQVDTAVLHVPRFDPDTGEEHPLADPFRLREREWRALKVGRRCDLVPGVMVEVDTAYSTPHAVRVTLGPQWTWAQGGVALDQLRVLVDRIDSATVQRVDVAHDFAAPTLEAAERTILKFYNDCRKLPAHRGQPAIWGRAGGSAKGLQAALGARGSAVQRRLYIKTSPYHWKRLQWYARHWSERGWRGLECPAGHAGQVLGRACERCGRGAVVAPAPVLRFEVEWPSAYLRETTPADLARAVDWVADLGGRGRASLLAKPVPPLVAERILALGRDPPSRPRQVRKDATAEGQVTYWHQIADHARRVAKDVAARSASAAELLRELEHRAQISRRPLE